MDSSLAHLCTTNNVPSHSELKALKDLLAPDEIELSRLEKEIKQIQELLQPLYKEKKAIEDRIRPLKSLSSLFRQLPNEIMQEIFMHSRPSPYSRTSGICDAPLLLLRVCRSWRDLALATPQLWASLEVAAPKHLAVSGESTDSKMDAYAVEIQRWIARSGDAPLSLRVRQDHYSGGHDTFFISILEDYLKHSTRLISLDLRVKRVVLEAITPTLDAQPLEGLSKVKIWDSSYDPPSKIFAASKLIQAKNLKHFHFLASYCPTFIDLPLKWSNLTSLSIGASQTTRHFYPGNVEETPFSSSDSISILRRTPHLVSCTLMLPSSTTQREQEERNDEHPMSVMLQNLETLRMTGPEEELGIVIRNIETPRIRHFTYHPWVPAETRSMTPIFQPFPYHPPASSTRPVPSTTRSSPLLDFFNRYGEGIESISIDPLNITENDLIACLEQIPGVKELYLGPAQSVSPYYHPATTQTGTRTVLFTNAHLALLTPNPHSLCPRLENFQCTMSVHLTQDAICSFLDARLDAKNLASGVGRIQNLSFSSLPLDFPLMEFMDSTNRYREECVKLHFWKEMHNQPTFTGGFNARYMPWMDDL